jgi:sterol desaturase/sphingolipid hydroxylase (fatty acid hydroxylase superfamily)
MDPVALRDLVPAELRPWLAGLLVGLLGAAILEGVVMSLRRRGSYDWWAFAASMGDALGRRTTDVVSSTLGLAFAIPLLGWVYEQRLFTIALDSWWALALLFFGEELCYYGYHRSAHRVRWFWATHAVHHSPNQLTLATALRLGWTGKITGTALFFSPLVGLGFTPLIVALAVAANLLYQFWLHTTWIPKLGTFFEWWFNTPSHHRVHHGRNPEYLDCNYGGVLIVFDRLFGSFVEERADLPPQYGLTTPLTTHNPIRIAFHEWIHLARDLRAATGWRKRARAIFGPPAARTPDNN